MQCLRIPTPWVHWQKDSSQEPSGNNPSSLQMWFLQFSCSVVVVSSEGELVVSLAREAERARGIRAKRRNFMVDDLNLVLELSGFGGSLGPCGFSLCFLDSAVLLATVTLSCVAPLFYTALPKLIKAYFT